MHKIGDIVQWRYFLNEHVRIVELDGKLARVRTVRDDGRSDIEFDVLTKELISISGGENEKKKMV